MIEATLLIGLEAPHLVGDALELRLLVRDIRATLGDPTALLERPGQLRGTFAELQAKAASIQSGLLQVRGGLEDDNSPLVHSVDTALQASALLEELGEGMERLAAATEEAFRQGLLSQEAGELLGEALPESRATIDSASQQLARLNELLSPSEASEEADPLLTMMAGLLGSPTSPLQHEETLLRTGSDLVDLLIYSLGYDHPRTYLIVGQNDDEIRASGGFIGVVVEATVDKGELTGLRYFDSTTVDGPPYDINPPAPEPILRYLWISKLLFRDANWNPHFPSTSAQLADLYLRAQGVRVDGVLAATEEVILDLVEDYGGIHVPELPGLLDREQAERYTEGELPYVCQQRHVSKRAKRCFDEDLFQAVIQRLTSPISEEERAMVVGTLLERLSRKDVLVHIFDEDTSDFLLEQGWNGAMTQVDHDYLMVVDSAVPGHVRKVVERRLHYQVSLSVDGPSSAELLVEYRHKSTDTDPDCRQAVTKPTGCFWNYVRAYIPVLASDIQAPPIPVHEGSEWLIWGYTPPDSLSIISSPRGGLPTLTEIGGYLTVEPGTTLTLPLRYKLPRSMVRRIGDGLYQYRLLIQKQPGTPIEPVSLFVQLPEGAVLASTSEVPSRQERGTVRLDFLLAADETVAVTFRMP